MKEDQKRFSTAREVLTHQIKHLKIQLDALQDEIKQVEVRLTNLREDSARVLATRVELILAVEALKGPEEDAQTK